MESPTRSRYQSPVRAPIGSKEKLADIYHLNDPQLLETYLRTTDPSVSEIEQLLAESGKIDNRAGKTDKRNKILTRYLQAKREPLTHVIKEGQETILFWLIDKGYYELLKNRLIELPMGFSTVYLNTPNLNGYRPLIWTIYQSNNGNADIYAKIFRLLIKHGARIDITPSFRSELIKELSKEQVIQGNKHLAELLTDLFPELTGKLQRDLDIALNRNEILKSVKQIADNYVHSTPALHNQISSSPASSNQTSSSQGNEQKLSNENLYYYQLLIKPEPINFSPAYHTVFLSIRYLCNYLGHEKRFNFTGQYHNQSFIFDSENSEIVHIQTIDDKIEIIHEWSLTDTDSFNSFIDQSIEMIQKYNYDYLSPQVFASRALKTYGIKKELLGRGGYGEVYSLIDNKSKIINYAVKIAYKSHLFNQQEIAIMLRCDHPNITKIVDIVSDRDLGIVMKIANYDLHSLISSNYFLDKSNINKYTMQLISGLVYLQNMDIVHFDIKPPNILYFLEDDCLKLSDFGLAINVPCSDLKTVKWDEVYTVYYRPIEYQLQSRLFSKIGEIWAMGLTILEMYLGIGKISHFESIVFVLNMLGTLTIDDMGPFYPMIEDIKNIQSYFEHDYGKNKLKNYIIQGSRIEIDESLIDLLIQMIAYPNKRIDSRGILNSEYYRKYSSSSVTRDQEIALAMCPDNCYTQLQIREFYPFANLKDLKLNNLSSIFSTVTVDLTFYMLKVLNSWIYDVTIYFDSPVSVYFSYLTILYTYLYVEEQRLKPIPRSRLQEIGSACYYIASSTKEIPVKIKEIVTMTEKKVFHDDLILKIKHIQIAMSFNFTFSTAYDYLNHYLDDISADQNLRQMSHDILLLLLSYSLIGLKYAPNMLAKLAIDLSQTTYIDPKLLIDVQTVIANITPDPNDIGSLQLQTKVVLEYLKKTYPSQ